MSEFLKVDAVSSGHATMSDGRTVRLGPLTGVSVGDILEVFADVAVSKADRHEAQSVARAREEVGV